VHYTDRHGTWPFHWRLLPIHQPAGGMGCVQCLTEETPLTKEAQRHPRKGNTRTMLSTWSPTLRAFSLPNPHSAVTAVQVETYWRQWHTHATACQTRGSQSRGNGDRYIPM